MSLRINHRDHTSRVKYAARVQDTQQEAAANVRKLISNISERIFRLAITHHKTTAIRLYEQLITLKDFSEQRLFSFRPYGYVLKRAMIPAVLPADELLSRFADFMRDKETALHELGLTVKDEISEIQIARPSENERERSSKPPPMINDDIEAVINVMKENLLGWAFTQERFLFMGIYDQLILIDKLEGDERQQKYRQFLRENQSLFQTLTLLES
ncbi:hypothetical protein HZB07_03085 [Candidatus Saganbacteria bacterium]|nr:hypothetical protein [Candidatus Saganbacteria bacterium]